MKPWDYGPLRVNETERYFSNGKQPFFWLGDTAWLLFSRLTENEAYDYLTNRKQKGYNVIQATLIHEWPQKNFEGANALEYNSFSTPDLASGYWQRIDNIINIAEELGIYFALLPTWGSNVKSGCLNMDNIDAYIDFLLERYGLRPNVIWLVGGDVRGDCALELFSHMGHRLKGGSRDQLVGFHPFGRTSSSLWFHKENWLDFNMFQSGHRRYDQVTMNAWDDGGEREGIYGEDNWRYVRRDLARTPLKPVLDGEPSYEQILQGLHDETQPYWQAADVRRYAYWSVFSGACGHTYGDNAIMQFFNKKRDEKGAFGVRQDWKEAMHNPGCAQMVHLKQLMEKVNFQKGSSEDYLVLNGQDERYCHISVFTTEEDLLAYVYEPHAFALSLRKYEGELSAYWFNPENGISSYIGRVNGGKTQSFRPPVRLEGQSDWVLILHKE